jgi:hypothetical protein
MVGSPTLGNVLIGKLMDEMYPSAVGGFSFVELGAQNRMINR